MKRSNNPRPTLLRWLPGVLASWLLVISLSAAAISVASPTSSARPASAEMAYPVHYLPSVHYDLPPTPLPTPTREPGTSAQVTHIVDGDTIDVSINGSIFRVRYIGMNTPEMNEPCGPLASQANAALVAGKTVRLVKDISETDRYGRLLRYVYVGDLFVNGELVLNGWAEAVRYPPDTAMTELLEYYESIAAGGCLVATPMPTASPNDCDPSYPTVCIPSPPPDLNCDDIPFKRFEVLPPDPHGFDGNNDGVGCEK